VEVKLLQPFSCLAFPFVPPRKTNLKQPIFGDELVTSFSGSQRKTSFCANRFSAHFQCTIDLALRHDSQ
jgi:hypothetical protein